LGAKPLNLPVTAEYLCFLWNFAELGTCQAWGYAKLSKEE